jgi:2-amino-4-hydroxy-6-hydroxymethyldihydropteridine diphosphokinase
MERRTRIFLGLGSNKGCRAGNVSAAVEAVRWNPHFRQVRVSRFYESSAVGPRQRDFVNAALSAETDLGPKEVLRFCKDTEKKLGRKPSKLRWGPRKIDLDVLFYGSGSVRAKGLVVPHRELAKRLFVLVPLAELAPGFKHPVLKKTVRTLLKIALLTCPGQKVKILRRKRS